MDLVERMFQLHCISQKFKRLPPNAHLVIMLEVATVPLQERNSSTEWQSEGTPKGEQESWSADSEVAR
eukprot:2497292-Amphidinium_carterae.1